IRTAAVTQVKQMLLKLVQVDIAGLSPLREAGISQAVGPEADVKGASQIVKQTRTLTQQILARQVDSCTRYGSDVSEPLATSFRLGVSRLRKLHLNKPTISAISGVERH